MTAAYYYGSTAFGWTTGASTAEVLAKLAQQAGANRIRRSVRQQGGLYAWTCRVEALPSGVTLGASREFLIQNTRGHVVPVDPKESA